MRARERENENQTTSTHVKFIPKSKRTNIDFPQLTHTHCSSSKIGWIARPILYFSHQLLEYCRKKKRTNPNEFHFYFSLSVSMMNKRSTGIEKKNKIFVFIVIWTAKWFREKEKYVYGNSTQTASARDVVRNTVLRDGIVLIVCCWHCQMSVLGCLAATAHTHYSFPILLLFFMLFDLVELCCAVLCCAASHNSHRVLSHWLANLRAIVVVVAVVHIHTHTLSFFSLSSHSTLRLNERCMIRLIYTFWQTVRLLVGSVSKRNIHHWCITIKIIIRFASHRFVYVFNFEIFYY